MTTFINWVQTTASRIMHLPHGQKYDLKRAQEPVVRGFSKPPTERAKWVSDCPLKTLGNRTVRQYSEDKASGTATIVATSPKRVMSPPSVVSNPTRTDGNRSWLHDHWAPRHGYPGQVRDRISFFERQGSVSSQATSARTSSPTASIKVKRPTSPPPAPPKPVLVSRHGKTKRAPQPPQPAPVQMKAPTALRGPDTSKPSAQAAVQTTAQPPVTKAVTGPAKTFTPPPAPPMDGLKMMQRAHSAPPLSPPNMAAVFAELKGHKLVQRSDSAPETMGTASETRAASGGRQISAKSWLPRKNGPMDATLQELTSSKRMPKEAKPIEVKPEVLKQAEVLRARLEAERSANQSVSPRRSVDSILTKTEAQRTYLPNGRLAPNTEQKRLIDELKAAQAVHGLKTAGAHGS